MREYLFRGMAVDTKKWVYGSLIRHGTYCCILDKYGEDDMDFPYLDSDLGTIDGQAIPVIPETVGIHTGRFDDYKNPFYEGDGVRCTIENIKYDYDHPILDFDNGTFRLPKISHYECRNGRIEWCDDLSEFRIHFYGPDGRFERRLKLGDISIKGRKSLGYISGNPENLKGEQT